MRTSTRAAIALLMIAALVGLGSMTASADDDENVEICHRTNSNGNPYVTPPPDPSGQNGGVDHLGAHTGPLWTPDLKAQHIKWGDIIPGTPGSEAYQDLIASEAWLEFVANGGDWEDFVAGVDGDDCSLPSFEVPTHDVTLAKVTSGDDPPPADTDFVFTIVCDTEGSVPESPKTISPEDGVVTVASGVAEGDTCTITETDAGGADDTTFTVGADAPVDADSVVATVGQADVAVVATNTFEADALPNVFEKPQAPVEPAQLPRTGTSTPYLVVAAAALLLAGGTARMASRRLALTSEV